MLPQLFSLGQAAARCGVPTRTLTRWATRGLVEARLTAAGWVFSSVGIQQAREKNDERRKRKAA